MELPIFETLHQAHSLRSRRLLSQHVAVEEFAWRPRSPFSLVDDVPTGNQLYEPLKMNYNLIDCSPEMYLIIFS